MNSLFASFAALALAGSSAAVPSVAMSSEPATSDPTTLQDDQEDPLDRYYDILWSRRYDDALAFASGFSPDNPGARATVDAMRAAALIGLKRDAEARSLIAEADRLAPDWGEPTRIVFIGGIVADRLDFAADALDRLIARAPDVARSINNEYVDYFFTKEPPGDPRGNQDRRIAIARIGYGGDTPMGQYVAGKGVDLLVRRGDFASAEKLLPAVLDPETIEDMLIARRYAPLWPKLEQLAGPHLADVRKASVDVAQRAYDQAPDSHRQLQILVNAFRQAGRLKDAIALRSKLPQDADSISAADEEMGWAINNVAQALSSAGRLDEADRLFGGLIDAPMSNGDWRVSMKINRLEDLVEGGRFDRALQLIEPTAKTEGTPYAAQLTRYQRYCTLRRLGRSEQAEKDLPEMMAHAEDAVAATIDGFLCAGEIDKAEGLALAQLKNPDEDKRLKFEKEFVRRLQMPPLTSDDSTVWQDAWRQLRQRPAIAAAFDKLGRDMPEALLPPEPDTGTK